MVSVGGSPLAHEACGEAPASSCDFREAMGEQSLGVSTDGTYPMKHVRTSDGRAVESARKSLRLGFSQPILPASGRYGMSCEG